MLSELRRYSHTLGVLYLSSKNRLIGYSEDERKALAASILLHDIGTPPFGHLLEYHFRERTGWNHEKIIGEVLWGKHAPENRAHQIFGGRTIEFQRELKLSGISFDLVEKIVTGQHPLSTLIFGTLDFDNIDNVVRMAWALGLLKNFDLAIHLASSLGVNKDSQLQLSSQKIELVRQWAALRKSVYEVLVFDPPTVAAQAVLSEALNIALDEGVIDEDDWHLSDEDLIDLLRSHLNTRAIISTEYLGRLPSMAFCVQIAGKLGDLKFESRTDAKKLVEEVLCEEFPKSRILGYIFVDRGTFEKKLTFCEAENQVMWEDGETSTSIVLYGFIRGQDTLPKKRCRHAVQNLLERLGVCNEQVKQCKTGNFSEPFYIQYPLTLSFKQN